MVKKSAPVWCTIIFHTSSTPKRFPDVRRQYTKGALYCVELPQKDSAGRPIIARYPLVNIFEVLGPHDDHPSATER